MTSNYEDFTDLITTSYRAIQKIKATGMKKINLKARDVDCIYYLSRYPEGLSNSRLVDLTGVDKAAVSRTLNHLADNGYVTLSPEDEQKKYGRRHVLTDPGRAAAAQIDRTVSEVVKTIGETINPNDRNRFYDTFHSISDQLTTLSKDYN